MLKLVDNQSLLIQSIVSKMNYNMYYVICNNCMLTSDSSDLYIARHTFISLRGNHNDALFSLSLLTEM